jgi:hypothetical protein
MASQRQYVLFAGGSARFQKARSATATTALIGYLLRWWEAGAPLSGYSLCVGWYGECAKGRVPVSHWETSDVRLLTAT